MDQRRLQPRLLLALLLFGWLVFLVVSYYVYHKPFTPELAVHLATTVFRCLVAFLIVTAAGNLGRRFLRLEAVDPLARLAAQAALGLALLAIAWLAIGAAGGLHTALAWIGLLLLPVVFRREARGWLADWTRLPAVFRSAGRLGVILGLILALILALALITALAPAVKFDALVYHLALPARYVEAGRFDYVPEIMFWGMPQTGELLYTWGMLLGGERLPALLSWAFGLLALTGVLGFTRSRFGPQAAVIAATALLSGATLSNLLSSAYVDWLVIFFGVCWLAMLAAWAETGKRSDLLLAGVFAGFALGTKYTAGVLLICGAAAIVYLRPRPFSATLARLALFGLAALAAASPWLLKNLIAVGNPAYPLLFPSGAMTPLRLALYQGGKPFGGWQDVALLPFRATFIGAESGPGYSASIGPLLFGLGLCALLAGQALDERGRSALRLTGLVAAVGVLVWMILGRFSSYLLQSRLYFAIFPALAALAGAGYLGLKRDWLPGVRLGRLAAGLVLLVAALNLLDQSVQALDSGAAQAVLGLRSEAEYLENNLGWYAPAMQAVRSLPDGSRTLLLWEPRGLYCQPACDPDEVLDRWLADRYPVSAGEARPSSEILSAWRAAGFTHVLYYRLGADFIRDEGRMAYASGDWDALAALLADLRVVEDYGEAYILYSLDERAGQ